MRESSKHQRAFEVFYSMGLSRSLAALATKLGVSHASTKLWSRTFGWTARIEERDRSVATLVEKQTTKVEVDRRTRNRKIVQAGILVAARAISDGRVAPTLSDLDRMIRLEEFLDGEASLNGDREIVIVWKDDAQLARREAGRESADTTAEREEDQGSQNRCPTGLPLEPGTDFEVLDPEKPR